MTTLDTPINTTKEARRAMIDSQLRTSGVNAGFVVQRMGAVARENFVPASAKPVAYMDRAIRLENGGALPAPLVQGTMLQEAAPNGTERALVVDNGSAYLAELLGPLVQECTRLSVEEALASTKNPKGFDLLLIDGAVEHLPKSLLDRLEEGARIVTGLVDKGVTRISVGQKGSSGASLMPVADMGIPRIVACDKPQGWSF